MFQFQTGAIKRPQGKLKVISALASFNSKLVRLKVKGVISVLAVVCMFQFQTGAIKSKEKRNAWIRELHVSIPNWCD